MTPKTLLPLTLTAAATLVVLLSTPAAVVAQSPDCSTPRRAVATWVENLADDNYHPDRAVECFDWEAADVSQRDRLQKAERLLTALALAGAPVDPESLSGDPDGGGERRAKLFDTRFPELYLVRDSEGRWVMSESSIRAIDAIYEAERPFDVDEIVQSLPTWMRTRPLFGAAWWQIFGAVLALLISFVVRLVVGWGVSNYGTKLLDRAGLSASADLVGKASIPIGTIAMAGVLWWSVRFLSFGAHTNQIVYACIRVLAAVSAVIVLYRIVDVVADLFARKAEGTETKLDDQLVPLVRRSVKAIVVVIGIIFVLQNMDVDVTSLLAMGTVGTLAISFAAKDMIANLFGSVSIFTDRPFHVGDWVKIGDIEGVVEEVGMRSTRVRTFYNSLITFPNSLITTTAVDNYGARQFRRCSITLNLTYDTSAEQIQAFCDGCRAVLKANPAVRQDYFEVHFAAFGSASLDVMLYFFFEVDSWSAELRERHNVFLEFLRLAKELGVEFAFPTQTLHVETMAEATRIPPHEAPAEEELKASVLAFAPGGKLSRPAGPRITHGYFPGQSVKGSDVADGGEG
jgi:MscS family membrane protein